MPKFRLIKDLPFQKADDTEWEGLSFPETFEFFAAGIEGIKDRKQITWQKYWGDPLTSGWFEEVVHERFKAKEGGIYFYVKLNQHLSSDNLVCETIETLSWEDAVNFEISNYFHTQEQAQEAAHRIKKLLAEYQEEINKE